MRAMEEAALKAFKQDLIKNPALAAQYGVRLPDAKKGSSFSMIFALIMLFMFRTPFVVRSVAHYHHFVWIRSLLLLQMLTVVSPGDNFLKYLLQCGHHWGGNNVLHFFIVMEDLRLKFIWLIS